MFFPVIGDPYYSSVSLLLPMAGSNYGTTFTDYSPSPKTVTRNNAVTKTAVSKWGNGSGYFDGTGDNLSIATSGDLSLTADFTIECWIYLASTTQNTFASILGSGNIAYGTGCVYLMVGSTRIVRMGGNWGAGSVDLLTAPDALSSAAWHYIAASRTGTILKLYIDGAQAGPAATSSATFDFSTTATYVGKNGWDGGNGELYGYLQDLRITKGVGRYPDACILPSGPLPPRPMALPIRSRTVLQPSHSTVAGLGL